MSYTNLNISKSVGVTASMFTAGCQSVISRRTFPLGVGRLQGRRATGLTATEAAMNGARGG